MEVKPIINSLLDKAVRSPDTSAMRIMQRAAVMLWDLDKKVKILEERQVTVDWDKRWIPVTERLPERGQEVVVFSGGVLKGDVFAYLFWNKDYASWANITHWMPLPEPPKEVE